MGVLLTTKCKMIITYEDSRLSDADIVRLREDSERYSLDDAPERDLQARNALASYCHDVQSKLDEATKKCKAVSDLLGSTDLQQIGLKETHQMKEEIECLLRKIRQAKGSNGGQ